MNGVGPIQAATTEELMAELLSRYDHAIFAAIADADRVGGNSAQLNRQRKGNYHACVGLAFDMAHIIATDLNKDGLEDAD